jgi:hypothetical protein
VQAVEPDQLVAQALDAELADAVRFADRPFLEPDPAETRLAVLPLRRQPALRCASGTRRRTGASA